MFRDRSSFSRLLLVAWLSLSCFGIRDNVTDKYSVYVYSQKYPEWTLLTPDTEQTTYNSTTGQFFPFLKLVIEYHPFGGLNETENKSFNETLPKWLTNSSFYTTVSTNPSEDFREDGNIGNQCRKGDCSPVDDCWHLYNCTFSAGRGMDRFYPFWVRDFLQCLETSVNAAHAYPTHDLQCAFKVADSSTNPWPPDRDGACGRDSKWDLTQEAWDNANTMENLQTFIEGGADKYGMWWPGWTDPNQTFTEALGLQLLSDPTDWVCTLNNPCAFSIDCHDVGVHGYQFGAFRDVAQTIWGYFVLRSIKNLNLQLTNHWQALQSAGTTAALETFDIEKFGPPSAIPGLTLANIITSLSIGFAVAVGLGSTPSVAGAKEIIAPVSEVFKNQSSNNAIAVIQHEQDTQRDFSRLLRSIYKLYEDNLQNFTADLFRGTTFNGDNRGSVFNISDMISGGRWVNPVQLDPITVIEERIRVEVLSRSINALWQGDEHSTSNKMWVTFFDLQDGDNSTVNCDKDTSGPNRTKYCADGGVYYAYNFIEEGDHLGRLGYPWGADKLKQLNIEPFVGTPLNRRTHTDILQWPVQASARTYRALHGTGAPADPFNYTNLQALSHWIENPPGNKTQLDARSQYGRLPGTWTLPVCDISGYGRDWNVDYTKPGAQSNLNVYYPGANSMKRLPHPPCICGFGGNETTGWAKAAGMLNFDTFYNRCRHILLNTGFKWPADLAYVNYGFGGNITNPNH